MLERGERWGELILVAVAEDRGLAEDDLLQLILAETEPLLQLAKRRLRAHAPYRALLQLGLHCGRFSHSAPEAFHDNLGSDAVGAGRSCSDGSRRYTPPPR